MNNHIKRKLHLGRAPCFGLQRKRLRFDAYMGLTGITALIAWHQRTGGDLTPWFGDWKPRPSNPTAAAAA